MNGFRRLTQLGRGQVQQGYLYAIGVVIVLAAIASSAHLIVAFSWANLPWMGVFLSLVVVLFNAMFFMLAIIRKDAPADMVTWIKVGFLLLAVVEWFGNYTAAGLYASQQLPPAVIDFIGLPEGFTLRVVAFLLGSFIPAISYCAMLALVSGGAVLLKDESGDAVAAAEELARYRQR